jgi:hypothetical protein
MNKFLKFLFGFILFIVLYGMMRDNPALGIVACIVVAVVSTIINRKPHTKPTKQ